MGHRTVVTVLVASMLVAGALAWQAVTAARQREAATDAMLRQYAQLAAWEFAREARKEIDKVISRTLARHIHPEHKAGPDPCDCTPLDTVEHWFEIPLAGTVVDRSGRLPPDTIERLARVVKVDGANAMDAGVRLWRMSDSDGRIVGARWEPHVGPNGGQLGLVISPRALAPVLAKTLDRAALLPPVLVGGRDVRRLVYLHVRDRDGATLFVSPDADRGRHTFETDLLADTATGLHLEASLAPAFIAALGPEHGAGPGRALVFGPGREEPAAGAEIGDVRARDGAELAKNVRNALPLLPGSFGVFALLGNRRGGGQANGEHGRGGERSRRS